MAVSTPTSLFDWTIYRHFFNSEPMAKIFGEQGAVERWILAEKAVAAALAQLDIAPASAARKVAQHANAASIDLERLHTDTLDVGRPIVGLARQIAEMVGKGDDVWVHYGISTYDIMDTGTVLQVRDGLAVIRRDMETVLNLFLDLAATHRDTVMIARTNGQYAQPITFGAKVATWIEEFMRHQDRLDEAADRALVIQFGGAVGTLASLHPHGLKFREAVAAELGLRAPLSNWHNARDCLTEVALHLGNLCASLARIARDINGLSGTDFGELTEGGHEGRGRSTSMAHKRNPRAAEFAEAVARLGRHRAMGMVEVMGQENDRCGGTYIAEWMLLPDTFLLTSGALNWAIDLLRRVEVNDERMRRNIGTMHGLALTERFTLALAKRIDKFEARRIIDKACGLTLSGSTGLAGTLAAMPEVLKVFSAEEIMSLDKPETYVGMAPEIVDRVIAAARQRRAQAS